MTNPSFPPAPDFIGDFLRDSGPADRVPRFIRRAALMYRWGMGDKALKSLIVKGILKPRIHQDSLILFDFYDVLCLERDGWPTPEATAPCEHYPYIEGK